MASACSLVLVVLPSIVLTLLLALDLTVRLRLLGYCIILSLCFAAVSLLEPDGVFEEYSHGATLGAAAISSFHLLFLVYPLRDYRHASDKKSIRDASFLQRWSWTTCMTFTFRGVGWNFRVKYIPEQPRLSRRAFVLATLLKIMKYLLALDLAHLWLRYHPIFSSEGASITSQGFLLRCISITAIHGIWFDLFSVNLSYHTLALICVGTGWYEPESWPDLFGRWSDAYTVRRFWGRTWHQFFRLWMTDFGKLATRLLGLRPSTLASSYTQLYIGFALSAIVHSFGDVIIGDSFIGTSWPIFISQAVVITVEDTVIAAGHRAGLKESALTRVIGYAWVCWWFAQCAPWLYDPLIQYGLSHGRFRVIEPMWIETIGGLMGVDAGSLVNGLFSA